MAFYCNEHRFYSRMAEEEEVYVPTSTVSYSHCNEHRAYSRFAQEEDVVVVAQKPTTTPAVSVCNEQRAYFSEWESMQESPVYSEIVPALMEFCNEHRAFSRYAEEVEEVVTLQRTGSSPVQICNEQRAYSRVAEVTDEEVAFSQRIFLHPAIASVSACNEGRAYSRVVEDMVVPLSEEVFEPVTPLCNEHKAYHAVEVDHAAAHAHATTLPSPFCGEHRAFANLADQHHDAPLATPTPISVSPCSEHRQVPHTFTTSEEEHEAVSVSASVSFCNEQRAYSHGAAAPAEHHHHATTLVASNMSDCCVGPFSASVSTDAVSAFFAGKEVRAEVQPSESLEASYLWYAIVSVASGTLVHVRFLEHLLRHPAVVGSQVLARAGSHVKGTDQGEPDVLAIVRLSADTVEEVLEVAEPLLATVAVPVTAAKAANVANDGVRVVEAAVY